MKRIFLTEVIDFQPYYGDTLRYEGERILADNIEQAEKILLSMHKPNCKIVGELVYEKDTDVGFEVVKMN